MSLRCQDFCIIKRRQWLCSDCSKDGAVRAGTRAILKVAELLDWVGVVPFGSIGVAEGEMLRQEDTDCQSSRM
jgi:hypothetical protein